MSRLPTICALLFLGSTVLWGQSADPAAASASAPQSASSPSDSKQLEVIKSKRAVYPMLAMQKGIQGQVVVQVLVNESGNVEKVEVVSGDPLLASAAVDAAKKFKFKPFFRDSKAIRVKTKLPFDFYFEQNEIVNGKSQNGLVRSDANKGPAPGGPAQAPTAVPPVHTVEVNQGISEGLLVHHIAPVYPELARRYRIQGTVVLNAIIDKDGRVSQLRAISGPEQLVAAAVGAVQ